MSSPYRRLALALAAAAALVPAPARAEPSRNVADYVIVAGDELIAKRLIVESGDVGVNSGILQSKKGVEGPSSRLVADMVRIGEKSSCLELSGNDVVQTGTACQLATGFQGPLFPSLAQACGFPAAPSPCDAGQPVVVGNKATDTLAPGAYGDVRVAGGSPGRGTLVLEGGDYSFCSLRLGPRARLQVRASSTVYVAGGLSLGLGTETGPAAGSNLDAADIELFVAGDTARLQRRAKLVGLLCAPNGLLQLMHGSRLDGRGVGKSVRIGRVTVRGIPADASTTTTLTPPTSTSTSSTTTTSVGAGSTTSTSVVSSTTSTSAREPSTTSTSSSTSSSGVVPTTSSTSSAAVTTTSSSTSSTVSSAVCGNGMTEAPETCDDGNTVDCGTPGTCSTATDFCAANCIQAACTNPQPANPRRNLDISVNATLGSGQKLGTVRVFLDYPEGVLIIPGSADNSQVVGSLSMTPAGGNCIPNDLDYGLVQGCLSFSGFNPGQFTRVGFADCEGATPPVAGDFSCVVLDATDQIGAVVAATCTVSLP